jgi:hypothetical protein
MGRQRVAQGVSPGDLNVRCNIRPAQGGPDTQGIALGSEASVLGQKRAV